jgi:beta-hydroxylase
MLAHALAPKFPVLHAFLVSAALLPWRGRVRHRFTRRRTDHPALVAPVNARRYARFAVPNVHLVRAGQTASVEGETVGLPYTTPA